MSKKEVIIAIGDEVRYSDRYVQGGYSNGKVVHRLDHSILVLEIMENGITKNKLVDETDIIELSIKK